MSIHDRFVSRRRFALRIEKAYLVTVVVIAASLAQLAF